MISNKDDGTKTKDEKLRELRGKTDRPSVHTMARDVSDVREGVARGWKGGCYDKKPVCDYEQGITVKLFQMGSRLRNSRMVGKKEVKRLGDRQRLQREKKLVSTRVTGFLTHLVKELADRLPDMSLNRAGRRFRKSLNKTSDKEKSPMIAVRFRAIFMIGSISI